MTTVGASEEDDATLGAPPQRLPLLAARTSSTASAADPLAADHHRVDAAAAKAKWFCLGTTKAEALALLPKNETGAFVLRPNLQLFATLSVVVGNRVFNAHVVETPEGLKLKNASLTYSTLSELIDSLRSPSQNSLPVPLSDW
jgi:hypothetical protein